MNWGKAIKTAREAVGMTQEELCTETDLRIEYLQELEEGIPTWEIGDALPDVCKALGVKKEILMILGIEDEDVPSQKKKIADALLEPLRNIIKEILKPSDESK